MSSPQPNTGKSVLLIEDDEGISDAMQEILTVEGYEVFSATNGQKALDWLASCDSLPGVILLDLTMPIMNGYEFRKVQMRTARIAPIPIVILSADRRAESNVLRLDVAASLNKPPDIDELLKVIEPYFI